MKAPFPFAAHLRCSKCARDYVNCVCPPQHVGGQTYEMTAELKKLLTEYGGTFVSQQPVAKVVSKEQAPGGLGVQPSCTWPPSGGLR